LTSQIYSYPTIWVFAWASVVGPQVKPDGSLSDEGCRVYFEEFLKMVSVRMSKDRLDSISVSTNRGRAEGRLTPSINEDSR